MNIKSSVYEYKVFGLLIEYCGKIPLTPRIRENWPPRKLASLKFVGVKIGLLMIMEKRKIVVLIDYKQFIA